MFEGKYPAAVKPNGEIILPPALTEEFRRLHGDEITLSLFGAQFIYICGQSFAAEIIDQLVSQVSTAFPRDKELVDSYIEVLNEYYTEVPLTIHFKEQKKKHRLFGIKEIELPEEPESSFMLPEHMRPLLGILPGASEVLTLIGVEDYLELWKPETFDERSQALIAVNDRQRRRANLFETAVCMHLGTECSLLTENRGKPPMNACGPCLFLRVP
ncbi:MAG: hypothetical protein LBR73_02230 [Oscillospiraceae bacterium]|jgi:hypothetical protein|nr:hypothetical protein [Oscillospiraceae bacterium]